MPKPSTRNLRYDRPAGGQISADEVEHSRGGDRVRKPAREIVLASGPRWSGRREGLPADVVDWTAVSEQRWDFDYELTVDMVVELARG